MELYSLLREFADSWALLMLFAVFLGVILWVLRPGSRKLHDDAANSIFRNDKKPAADSEKSRQQPDREADTNKERQQFARGGPVEAKAVTCGV